MGSAAGDVFSDRELQCLQKKKKETSERVQLYVMRQAWNSPPVFSS